MPMPCCEVCGEEPNGERVLYRTGKKGPGENPHWRCEEHLKTEDLKALDPDLQALLSVLTQPDSTKKKKTH